MAELNLHELEKLATAGAQAGSGGLLTQIAALVKDFREGAELLGKLREQNLTQAAGEVAKREPEGGMKQFINLVNSLGLGDLPVGKILEQIGPYSLNQLKNMGDKMLIEAPGDKTPDKPGRPAALDDVRRKAHEN